MISSDNTSRKVGPIFWPAFGLVAAGLALIFIWPGAVESILAWWNTPALIGTEYPGRGLDTLGQLWRRGYLGVFFNYEYYGFLPMLGLPALILFLATPRVHPRWQWALVFAGVCAAILIGVKGYYNIRYACTLEPLLVMFAIYVAWTFSRRPAVRAICLAIVILLIFGSFRIQAGRYVRYFGELSAFPDERRLPYKFINYLNSVSFRPDRGALVMGDAWPYYYTRCRAMNFNHPDVFSFVLWAEEDCFRRLLKDHGIRYILSDCGSDVSFAAADSLKNFIDLLSARTLMINDGRFSLRCIEPELKRSEMENLACQGRNLVSNWSFDVTSGPNTALFWRVYNGTGAEPAKMRYETNTPAGGQCAVLEGDNFHLVQDIRGWERLKGKTVTAFARMKTPARDKYALQLYDGVGQAQAFHPGNGEWMILRAALDISATADCLEFRAISAYPEGGPGAVRVEDLILVEGLWFMPADLVE